MTTTEFQWGPAPLNESWWTTTGAELTATPEQIKFACARHQGASATKSAKLAGYPGTGAALRQAGYRVLRSTAVTNLLSLAAAESEGNPGGISDAEIDAKLAKMIRSPDHNVSIRAIESHAKREATRSAERANEPEMSPEDVVRSLLELGDFGRGAALALYRTTIEEHGGGRPAHIRVAGLPLFVELVPTLSREFPDLWESLRSKLDAGSREQADLFARREPTPLSELAPQTAAEEPADDDEAA